MKNALILFAFIFLTSFTNNAQTNKLPNGHYIVKMDDSYKERGANDFDFTLENENFTMKIANKYEVLKINWLDNKTFAVLGFTEPSNPNEFEKSFTRENKQYFQIAKIDDNEYYFIIGLLNDNYPTFAGKIIKTE